MNLAAEEGYEEQASRHAIAMEWNDLTQRAEQAIREWLLANRGEEKIPSRRYYEFWNVEQRGGQRYLLVVTALKQARGNYSVTDLVVVHSNPIAKVIIYEFGDYTDRYIDQIELREDGIQIDYFRREQGAWRPAIPGRSMFVFIGDTLQETVVGLPEERVHAMELKLAEEDRAQALAEQRRLQQEKTAATQRQLGADGKYTIMTGDTAVKIARTFQLRIDQLFSLNPEVDWAKLKVGQRVQIRPAATPGDRH